jgi:hypothetical protein
LTENSVVCRKQPLFNNPEDFLMSKLFGVVLAAAFALVTVSQVAFAQTQEKKKADPVAAACKGKKAGDMVKVGGKDVKCPAPKAAAK